ncbi:DUF6466 family protein [Bifidobacterium tsurumiense]|uniref:DUF6466 family protein n=1 Tax=Bifidobacterium tsurumiense TaxID=356829 RepID=UPI0012B358A0|nr:DUF6466 family protein [Bifidobacterium tsurumiense]MSS12861.1 cell surface protein [Bifidobacterium tsurumiense]
MTSTNQTSSRQSRSSLPVRITLFVAAALVLIVGVLAGINLYAVNTYNQATGQLNSIIEASSHSDADLETLRTQQQQVLSQLSEASSLSAFLLPGVKDAINTNTAVSQTLHTRITEELTTQEQGSSTLQQGTSSDATGNGSSGSAGGLTEEQKKQVEDLLKANQQSTDSSTTSQEENQQSDSDDSSTTVKPW